MEFKTSTIRQKVTIRASAEEVYETSMNPKIHSEFTGSKVKKTW